MYLAKTWNLPVLLKTTGINEEAYKSKETIYNGGGAGGGSQKGLSAMSINQPRMKNVWPSNGSRQKHHMHNYVHKVHY